MNAKARRLARLPRLPRRVHVYAAALLALPRHTLTEPVFAEDRDANHYVQVLLCPVAPAYPPAAVPRLGRYYSPVEEQIVRLLAGGEALQGKQIAAALSWPSLSELRGKLRTLEERGVIVHTHGEGYTLAPPSLDSYADPPTAEGAPGQ